MDVNQPVNQDDSHVLIDLSLSCHVVRLWIKDTLFTPAPEVDVIGMLVAIERNPRGSLVGLPVSPESGWIDIFDFQRP
jgi:hypothetical protein